MRVRVHTCVCVRSACSEIWEEYHKSAFMQGFPSVFWMYAHAFVHQSGMQTFLCTYIDTYRHTYIYTYLLMYTHTCASSSSNNKCTCVMHVCSQESPGALAQQRRQVTTRKPGSYEEAARGAWYCVFFIFIQAIDDPCEQLDVQNSCKYYLRWFVWL